MRFDAYAATVPDAELHAVGDVLADAVAGLVCDGKPMRRYAQTWRVDDGSRTAAWFGHDAASGAIYVEAKGETTPLLVRALRTHFPGHTVPRADVCEDYDEPGAFDRLRDLVRRYKGQRVRGGYKELPDDEKDGKTWQAGVRGGVSMIRVYEAGKHPDRVALGRPNWARLELECRPHYARDKRAAASMQPAEMWGFSAWTHKVGEAVMQTELERFAPEVRRYTQDKTTLYLARTFRRFWEVQQEAGIHWDATCREIWRADDEAKRGYRGHAPDVDAPAS